MLMLLYCYFLYVMENFYTAVLPLLHNLRIVFHHCSSLINMLNLICLIHANNKGSGSNNFLNNYSHVIPHKTTSIVVKLNTHNK